jgi:hypothetical protein
MHKQNCWEAHRCGREPGGPRVSQLGVCPAATQRSAAGVNGGDAAGRVCWAVSGTLCGGKVCGTHAEKRLTCLNCTFYKQVAAEEGLAFQILIPGQTYYQHANTSTNAPASRVSSR